MPEYSDVPTFTGGTPDVEEDQQREREGGDREMGQERRHGEGSLRRLGQRPLLGQHQEAPLEPHMAGQGSPRGTYDPTTSRECQEGSPQPTPWCDGSVPPT